MEQTLLGLYEKGHFNVMVNQSVTGKDENSYNKLQLNRFNKKQKPSIFYTIIATSKETFQFSEMKNTLNNVFNNFMRKLKVNVNFGQR